MTSGQVSYQLSSSLALGVKVLPQNPPTKTENTQGPNAQTDAATMLKSGLTQSQVPGSAVPLAPLANWRDQRRSYA